MILRVSSTGGQNRNPCAPIPVDSVDWLGSGFLTPRAKGGRPGPTWLFRGPLFSGGFVSVGISYGKKISQKNADVASVVWRFIQGQLYSSVLDHHAFWELQGPLRVVVYSLKRPKSGLTTSGHF